MKKENFFWIILGAIVVVAVVLRLLGVGNAHQTPVVQTPISTSTVPVVTATTSTPIATPVTTISPVTIFMPQAGTVIHSPLVVAGQAPGNWFF